MANIHVSEKNRPWETRDIVGMPMKMAELWDDGNCSARVVEMLNGKGFGLHRHETWIMVYVLSGKVRVVPEDIIVEPGGFYFVEPGTEHDEIGLEKHTTVLVIRDEPNKQYPVPKPKT
jgi:quercetin dioxygenase-like cupin family protein